MIKFIVAALWISGVTVAAMFYSFQSTETKAAVEEPAPMLGGLDYIKTEIMSVPVLSKSGVSGYFLARLVYTIEAEKAKKLSVPAATLIGDEVYTYLFTNPDIDFTNKDSLDIDRFRNDLRDRLNKRIGEEMIHDVMVEQIDFLSKEEIRDNNIRRKRAEAVAAARSETEEPKKKSGHGGDESASDHGAPAAEDHGKAPSH